jgi:hypothetical protein
VTTASRQVIARRYAWAAFYVLMADLIVFFAAPRYWTWHECLYTGIVAMATGTVARIYLRRTGGKL